MPIYYAVENQELTIKRITGTDKIKTHLSNLGFIIGETITLVTKIDENVIVKLKGVSLAISSDMAKRILV